MPDNKDKDMDKDKDKEKDEDKDDPPSPPHLYKEEYIEGAARYYQASPYDLYAPTLHA